MQRFAKPTSYNVFNGTKKLSGALNRFEASFLPAQRVSRAACMPCILLSYLAACIWHTRGCFRNSRRARKVCINRTLAVSARDTRQPENRIHNMKDIHDALGRPPINATWCSLARFSKMGDPLGDSIPFWPRSVVIRTSSTVFKIILPNQEPHCMAVGAFACDLKIVSLEALRLFVRLITQYQCTIL